MNKRRLLLISISIYLTVFSVSAVKSHAQPIEIGFKGGATVSAHFKAFYFSEEDIQLWLDPKPTTGFHAGLIARIYLSGTARLQAEPSLILLGAHYDQPFSLRGFEFNTESRTELLYLQMPLLVQLSTSPKDRTAFGRPFNSTTYHLTGGIFGGYLLDAEFTGTNTGTPIGVEFEGDFTYDVTYQYKEYDGGVMLGAGFEHGSKQKVGFEVRVQYSVIDSGNHPRTQFFQPYNIGVTFSASYLF